MLMETKLMIVEDEKAMLESMKQYLEAEGFLVYAVTAGE